MTSSPHRITDTILDVNIKTSSADVSTSNPLPVTNVTPTGAATATYIQGFKTVTATNTPELVAASSTKVASVVFQGYKAQGTLNTGNVYIGSVVTDATDPVAILPGGSFTITAPPGKFIDLNTLYIDVATAADGVGYFGVV
jgi:hypothetical protein